MAQRNCPPERGFTLVEILVVLVILAVTAAALSFGFQRLEADRVEKQAGQLTTWLQSISDDAVLDGAIYGAWLAEGDHLSRGYYFANRWWPVKEDDIPLPQLGEGVALLAEADNGRYLAVPRRSREEGPNILFLPSGITEPDSFELKADDRVATIERDEDGIFTWSIH